MHVRDARIKEAVKTLDEAVKLDFELISANDCTVNGCIKGRSVASGRQYSDSFHNLQAWL
jgi:hypothetical protein